MIDQTNRITDFTRAASPRSSTGPTAHTTQTFPVCPSFVQVKGNLRPGDIEGHQVFICFGRHTKLKDPTPVAPPPGTPGT